MFQKWFSLPSFLIKDPTWPKAAEESIISEKTIRLPVKIPQVMPFVHSGGIYDALDVYDLWLLSARPYTA
jgi:hypothetical protein